MAITPLRSSVRFFAIVVSIVAAFAARTEGQSLCATHLSQDQQAHPQFSATLPNLLTTAGNDNYIYEATEWGYVRASLANPSSPGPLKLIQIGQKTVTGGILNGGLIYQYCDCNQGANSFAAAEASDGSSRMISDWVAPSYNVVRGMLAQTAGAGDPAFGQQVNISGVGLSSQVAAVYMPGSNKYFGYFPATNQNGPLGTNGPIQIVDLTNPSGSLDFLLALQPIGTFNWPGVYQLTTRVVSVGGLQKTLLAGYVGSDSTLRVAEIDNNGTPTQKASIPSSGPNAIYIATVNSNVYVFSADNGNGLNVYQYTGSALNFAGNIPGYFNNVVVKGAPGSPYPAIFVHRGSPTDSVDIYDTKWLTSGTPVRAFSIPHQNSPPPTGRGNAIEAVVTGTGSSIIAHVYRLANATVSGAENTLLTDNIDISCIAADTTSPPTPNATWSNLSIGARAADGHPDTNNYYGDYFQLTDQSGSGVPILNAYWDTNTDGTHFTTGGDFTTAPPPTSPNIAGFLPCDAANGGDFLNGPGCAASVGLIAMPAAPQSFRFGEQSRNQNGLSIQPSTTNPPGWFASAPIPFLMPAIGIVGFDGTTLRILTGGNADASLTQGNTRPGALGAAVFNWTFSPGGPLTGRSVLVPAGATTFSLTVNWPTGYSQTISNKAIFQTDLVPAFTLSPNPVSLGAQLNLTNAMQKAPTANLTNVDWQIALGTCPGNPTFSGAGSGTLAASFLNAGGTAAVTAPSTPGAYCVSLRYDYTPQGGIPTQLIVSNPVTVANAAISASVSGPSTGTAGASLTFTANATGGTGVYTYAWDCNFIPPPFGTPNWGTPSSSPSTQCSWTSNGGHNPGVKVTDTGTGSAIVYGNVTITGGTTTLTASVSGPSTGAVSTPLTYFATASGGNGSFSYSWACDYIAVAPSFVSGGSSTVCTYSTNGAHTVAVQVASGGANAFGQTSVSIGGSGSPGGGPSAVVTGPGTGSANASLTYAVAASGGTAPYTYAWACDYNALAGTGQFIVGGATNNCVFTGNGVHNVAAKVTDSAARSTVGTYSTTISGPGLPSVQFTTTGPGAISVSGTTYTVGANQPVTFSAAEGNASMYAWAFGDGSAAVSPSAKSVTKTYTTKGTLSAALSVTGDGNNTAGSNTANFTVQVVTPAPSGVFTISGAVSNSDGTVFTANVGDTIKMSAAEASASSWGWDFGDSTGGSARSVTKAYSALGSYKVTLYVTGLEPNTTGATISTFTINVVSCVSTGTTLCLNDNRFKATVNWAVPAQGTSGAGNAVALTGDTGYYWFFSPANIELVLKVVDGRTFNGNFWVFYGALSNVQYDITIKDMTTGNIKTYHNADGTTASVADVNAFPDTGTASKRAQAVSSIGVACTPSPATIGQTITCTASPAGTYGWTWGDESVFPAPFAPGPNPNTHVYTRASNFPVTVSTDSGKTTGTTTVHVTGTAPGALAATISGPGTGATGDVLSFTGAATGGTAPYQYAWDCENSGTYTAGTATNSCSYSTTGSHIVGLKVTDSAAPTPGTTVTTKPLSITAPAGPTIPSNGFTLSGATLNPVSNRYETEVGRTVTFTPTEQNVSKVGWAFGDGSSAETAPPTTSVTHVYRQLGGLSGTMLVYGDEVKTTGLNIANIPISVLPCAADGKTLCLNGGRFKVTVTWSSDTGSGDGTAVPVTSDTGEFWFLSANNIELVLKVVDGTAFNGHYWVFYGALSNLQYTITVTDTTTGAVKTYNNPQGTTASEADVNAF